MNDFGVTRAPRNIVFGLGQRGALGRAAVQLSRVAFVCTDQRLSAEPVFAAMMDDLKGHGIAVRVYDRTVAELPLGCVDEALRAASGFGADLVIGVGGGSCMDLAKVVALLLALGGHPRDLARLQCGGAMLSGAKSVGRPSMLFMFFRPQYLRRLLIPCAVQ